jgi:hypothetical protein
MSKTNDQRHKPGVYMSQDIECPFCETFSPADAKTCPTCRKRTAFSLGWKIAIIIALCSVLYATVIGPAISGQPFGSNEGRFEQCIEDMRRIDELSGSVISDMISGGNRMPGVDYDVLPWQTYDDFLEASCLGRGF